MLIDGLFFSRVIGFAQKFYLVQKKRVLRKAHLNGMKSHLKHCSKCEFNEMFVVSFTINHLYLFYDLLISLQ